MVHILWISEDTSRLITKNFVYLEQELEKFVTLSRFRKSGHIDSILKQISQRPDFILLLNDMEQKIYPLIKGLQTTDIPVGLFINDIHRFTKRRENDIQKFQIPYLFTVVRDPFLKTYPNFQHKMEWFPHFIHPEIYKDYERKKDIPMLMMGAVNDVYPLRKKIRDYYDGNSRFIYHAHPGYRAFSQAEEKHLIMGTNYAQELNRSKIFFTSPSVFHYPVLKYFEALACKTLLLAPTFKELEDLGFIPDYHFIAINEHNFAKKAAYYLENESERNKITEQGYQFVHQTHTVQIRTKQLVQRIKHILRQ